MKRFRLRFTNRDDATIYECDQVRIEPMALGGRTSLLGNITVDGKSWSGGRYDRKGSPTAMVQVDRRASGEAEVVP